MNTTFLTKVPYKKATILRKLLGRLNSWASLRLKLLEGSRLTAYWSLCLCIAACIQQFSRRREMQKVKLARISSFIHMHIWSQSIDKFDQMHNSWQQLLGVAWWAGLELLMNISPALIQFRGVVMGGISVFIPPKSAQVNFLWGKSDIRTAIQQFYTPKTFIPPKTNFWLRPCDPSVSTAVLW